MAYRVIHNRANHSIVIHATSTSANIVVVGNTSQSNIASNGDNASITGASITQIWYGGESTSVWTIKRGANTVWVGSCSAGDYIDFAGSRNAIDLDANGDISISLAGGANAYCMVELKKLNMPTKYV